MDAAQVPAEKHLVAQVMQALVGALWPRNVELGEQHPGEDQEAQGGECHAAQRIGNGVGVFADLVIEFARAQPFLEDL